MAKRNVSSMIERMESLEQKLGIRIEGAYADQDREEQEFEVRVLGEIRSIEGDTIPADVRIEAAIYNGKGQVTARSVEHVLAEDFLGLSTFELRLYSPEAPAKIRLIPARG